MTIALKTIEQFVARVCRLCEQSQAEPLDSSRLGDYVRQWVRWFKGVQSRYSQNSGYSEAGILQRQINSL